MRPYLLSSSLTLWPLSGQVRCGLCNGPMGVIGANGRLGCINHRNRGTCSNNRTLLRAPLVQRALIGLRERLAAPELIDAFVQAFTAQITVSDRERGHGAHVMAQDRATRTRQVHNLLDLMKEGLSSAAMVAELHTLEQRAQALAGEVQAKLASELIVVAHPNLQDSIAARSSGWGMRSLIAQRHQCRPRRCGAWWMPSWRYRASGAARLPCSAGAILPPSTGCWMPLGKPVASLLG